MSTPTPLEIELRRLIAAEGPLSIAHYMALCLSHPRHGYYMRQDPFGAAGDFTTAPEISQVFGELLGLWAAAVWQLMGSPGRVLLTELGPGRGTLMADALRAAKVMAPFRAALSVHLVEQSPVLRERQQATLAAADTPGVPIAWHQDVTDLPDAPLIVIANEFLDALPVNQAVKADDGWHERAVGLDAEGRLAFGLQPACIPRFEELLPPHLAGAPTGAVYEWRGDAAVAELCRRVSTFGGAALIIDYGHAEPGFGDTLQAVRAHAFADPLARPGEADLTAHVDFAAVGAAAARFGARVHGPLMQRDFLRHLGIEARAATLKASTSADQAAAIDAAVMRLVGSGPRDMGALFKAMAFADARITSLPGFDS